MATFVLLPGAGSDSWYWHRVVPLLRDAGHETVAVDLLCDDDRAGLPEYTETALDAIGDRGDLVVVAQSMGGFTAPLIAARVPVDLIVLVAAMVPLPGETPGDWWENTDHRAAFREQAIRDGRDPDHELDPAEVFLHDVPPAVAAESAAHARNQSGTPFEKPWPLDAWPAVDPVPAVSRRPVLPARLPPPSGEGATRYHARRDGRRPPTRPQPPPRTRRAAARLPPCVGANALTSSR